MKYTNIVKATFINRPNRFIANVKVNGKTEIAHVKNTGRCKELLTENADIFLWESDNPQRKTKYDLISVYKGNRLINMDSQIPNKVFAQWIQDSNFFKDVTLIKPETTFGKSRFDFYIETKSEKIFVEIKGVTLEEDGVVLFPDAPTERGVKHTYELCECIKSGYKAYLFFIIQMKDVKYFTPNVKTQPEFAKALKYAKENGVEIKALDCVVTCDSITADEFVDVIL